jgi:hypothetical protein
MIYLHDHYVDDAEEPEAFRDVNIRGNELILWVKKEDRPNSSFMKRNQELVLYLVKNRGKWSRHSFFR